MDSWPPSAGSTHTSLQRPRWSLDTHNAPLCHVLSQERQGRPEGTHSTCMGRPHMGAPGCLPPPGSLFSPSGSGPLPPGFGHLRPTGNNSATPDLPVSSSSGGRSYGFVAFVLTHVLRPPVAAPAMRLTISHPGSLPRHHAPTPRLAVTLVPLPPTVSISPSFPVPLQ